MQTSNALDSDPHTRTTPHFVWWRLREAARLEQRAERFLRLSRRIAAMHHWFSSLTRTGCAVGVVTSLLATGLEVWGQVVAPRWDATTVVIALVAGPLWGMASLVTGVPLCSALNHLEHRYYFRAEAASDAAQALREEHREIHGELGAPTGQVASTACAAVNPLSRGIP